jgi:hypothetical protein
VVVEKDNGINAEVTESTEDAEKSGEKNANTQG